MIGQLWIWKSVSFWALVVSCIGIPACVICGWITVKDLVNEPYFGKGHRGRTVGIIFVYVFLWILGAMVLLLLLEIPMLSIISYSFCFGFHVRFDEGGGYVPVVAQKLVNFIMDNKSVYNGTVNFEKTCPKGNLVHGNLTKLNCEIYINTMYKCNCCNVSIAQSMGQVQLAEIETDDEKNEMESEDLKLSNNVLGDISQVEDKENEKTAKNECDQQHTRGMFCTCAYGCHECQFYLCEPCWTYSMRGLPADVHPQQRRMGCKWWRRWRCCCCSKRSDDSVDGLTTTLANRHCRTATFRATFINYCSLEYFDFITEAPNRKYLDYLKDNINSEWKNVTSSKVDDVIIQSKRKHGLCLC